MKPNITQWIVGLGSIIFAQIAQADTLIGVVDLSGTPILNGSVQYTAFCSGTGECMQAIDNNGGSTQWSFSTGTGYNVSPSNETAELAFLNNLLTAVGDAPPLVSAVMKTDIEAQSFKTDSQYFSIKQQTWTVFFNNLSGSELTIQFDPANFSHWTEYGDSVIPDQPPQVPLPAAAWLFGSALLGLAGVARRKRTV